MKRLFLLSVFLVLMSSCATIVNSRYTDVKVHNRRGETVTYTNERNRIDTAYSLPDGTSIFPALRSQRTIEVKIATDTSVQNITLLPTHSRWFYANLFYYWAGMLVDCASPKRFSYPSNIYPDKNAKDGFRKSPPLKPYTFSLTIQPPLVTAYFLNAEQYDFTGNVWGIGAGINYYYSRGGFFSSEAVAATARRGAAQRYLNANGGYRQQNFVWVSLAARNHHAFGRLDLGYGLSASWQQCKERDVYTYDDKDDEKVLVRQDNPLTLGLATSVNIRLTNEFCVGFNYQPQFLSLTGDGAVAAYSHVASAGFFWRIGVTKPKR